MLLPAEADVVVAELQHSRDKAAGSAGDPAVIDALEAEWKAQLIELLTVNAAAAELGEVNCALEPLLSEKREKNVRSGR
jgi:hypothetical protein